MIRSVNVADERVVIRCDIVLENLRGNTSFQSSGLLGMWSQWINNAIFSLLCDVILTGRAEGSLVPVQQP